MKYQISLFNIAICIIHAVFIVLLLREITDVPIAAMIISLILPACIFLAAAGILIGFNKKKGER